MKCDTCIRMLNLFLIFYDIILGSFVCFGHWISAYIQKFIQCVYVLLSDSIYIIMHNKSRVRVAMREQQPLINDFMLFG